MGLPTPKSEDADKASLLSGDAEGDRHNYDGVSTSPRSALAASKKSDGVEFNNGYLAAPLSERPISKSPDTLSNLSADGYRSGRSSQQTDGYTRSPLPSPASPPKGWRGKFDAFWIRNKGLAYVLCGQVFGTLMNVTTRLLEIEGNNGKGMHPFQILFARMVITLGLASGYMWFKHIADFPFGKPEVRWLLVARGIGGFFGVFGMYYSLMYLPLADATVITFLAPSITCWACSILINEPFTRREKIAGLVSFVGVILISRPTSLLAALAGGGDTPPASGDGDVAPSRNNTMPVTGPNNGTDADAGNYGDVTPVERLSAVGVALVGVLGASTAYTTIRWIGTRAHPLLSVNYFAATCTVISLIAQLTFPGVGFLLPANMKEWGYLVFLGACGFIMQFLLAAGLAYEKSSRATNMTYTQMLFALGFDKLIFGHTPGVMSILGSSLILGSAIIVAIQQDPSRGSKEGNEESGLQNDEESRTGLMSSWRDAEIGEDHERLPVQEIQMRALR